MLGNTDKPIEKIADDTFGINSYVAGLCSFIMRCDTPMTISIQGDWGSGKTSMMNMIKEKIANDVCPIWLNTWQFSQFKMQEEISTSLLYSLLAELDYSKENMKKIVGFLSGAAKLATGIITEKVAGGYLAGELTEAMANTNYDYAAEIKNLKSKFQEAINKKLKAENKERVVIFVDDLDRLQPEKAVELLEVLKVFLDCENCVYILAVDYEVVTQGIKKKFGDSVGAQKGKSFFDKIIQLPFKMPVAQYDISKYVEKMLKEMKGDVGDEIVSEYVSLIGLSVGCNPRSMKRLFNTYLLLDIILKSKFSKADRDSSNQLLFAIVCMQTEFEGLYRYIVSNRDGIDSDTLISLEENINSNEDVKSELNMEDEADLSRISYFMAAFNQLLKDENSNISDEKINKLKELLSFSTVTSVNVNDDAYAISEDDKKYKAINFNIVKKVNCKLKDKYDFKLHRININIPSFRCSTVWGQLTLNCFNGIECSFEYYLVTDYSTGMTSLNMSIEPANNLVTDEAFNNLFKENPLSYNCKRNKRQLEYEKIFVFSDAEAQQEIENKIVPIVEDAVDKLINFIK